MSIQTQHLALLNRGGFSYYSTIFNGSNTWLARGGDLTGFTDGKEFTLSFWLKMSEDGTNLNGIFSNNTGLIVYRYTNGRIFAYAANSAASQVLLINTIQYSNEVADGWTHVFISVNLAIGAANLYINGVDQKEVGGSIVNDNIDFTTGNYFIGARYANYQKLNGLLCELWFDDVYLDTTAITKFRSAGGAPVSLGNSGQTPTGSTPLVYLKTKVPNFETNSGSGGNFIESGTLIDGGSDKP